MARHNQNAQVIEIETEIENQEIGNVIETNTDVEQDTGSEIEQTYEHEVPQTEVSDETEQETINQIAEGFEPETEEQGETKEDEDAVETVSQLMDRLGTKSAVIRHLASTGMTVSQINKAFEESGVKMRYQHVRNVLHTILKKAE